MYSFDCKIIKFLGKALLQVCITESDDTLVELEQSSLAECM